MILSRVAEQTAREVRKRYDGNLLWYPAYLLFYSAGIAAIAAKKYRNLRTCLLTSIEASYGDLPRVPLAVEIGDGLTELYRGDAFKKLPGLQNRHLAVSEHLCAFLQPEMDNMFFLGREYEGCFDRFEVLFALAYGFYRRGVETHFWAPPGRFVWKAKQHGGRNPLSQLLEEAQREREKWEPIASGAFPGSADDFAAVSGELVEFVRAVSVR